MNANAFRHFYGYHFSENRKVWDTYITPLSEEQFTQMADYSRGSVRNQIIHLIRVDAGWFSGLRGVDYQSLLDPDGSEDRTVIRARWDGVEQDMRGYLAKLTDEMLLEKPYADGDSKDLVLWQVLLHVVNHGTDHRAQVLRLLSDLGVKTTNQDYMLYVYSHP